MAQAISFSLFGYGDTKHPDCFQFQSYLVGLSHNIKMRDLLFPDWTIYLVVDDQTYEGEYKGYFDYLNQKDNFHVEVTNKEALCMMMIKRVMPIFDERFDRVICRDTDSLLSYKERQAVQYWISTGRVAHAITDSVSHNITFLGGMCGFQSKELRDMMNLKSFGELKNLGNRIDWARKGADQEFLNKVVLPVVHTSIVEHYLDGMPQSFRGECYRHVQDMPLPDVPIELKESNYLIEHIGQSGVIVAPVLKFFDKYQSREQKAYYDEIENEFKDVFYWKKWE